MAQRKFARARKALLSAQPRDERESSRLHRAIADTLRAEDRTSEAIAEMEAALDADPQDRELLLQLANMLADSRRYTQAIAVLQRVAGAPNDVQKKIDTQISEFESKQRSDRSRLLLESSKSIDPTVQAEGNRW
jgi:predicted Zn-dependent protease